MAFHVEDFQDLIRLLQQRPEWRADLRRLVLTDELLALPELVRELVQAQQRTEVRVARLEESVESLRAETERRFQELVAAQLTLTGHMDVMRAAIQSLEEHTATLTTLIERLQDGVGRLQDDVGKLHDDVGRLQDDVGELKGSDLERRYRERPFAYFNRLIRQAHTLSADELNAMLDRAVTAGQLTEEDVDEIVWADAIIRGRRRDDDQEVFLVVEASWGVGPYDVQRADRRAQLLAKAGLITLPVVAGMWMTPDGEVAARATKVWRVTNGRAVPPEQV